MLERLLGEGRWHTTGHKGLASFQGRFSKSDPHWSMGLGDLQGPLTSLPDDLGPKAFALITIIIRVRV